MVNTPCGVSKPVNANPARVAVLGIGNILFTDEGLGIYAVAYLQQNYRFSPMIDLIDGGTLGMNLLQYCQDYEQLIIVDTISGDKEGRDQAGSLYRLDHEALQGLGHTRRTAHEVEVLQTLELAALSGEIADVQIIAMVPEDIESVAMLLTDTIQQQWHHLIQTLVSTLASYGVNAIEKPSMTTLSNVIAQYQYMTLPKPE